MIRAYSPKDREALLNVWHESAQLAHPFWPAERFDDERRAIAEQFLPRAETYVFERGGSVVGFISLLGGEVGGLFVTPRHHRAGIGRALMDLARTSRDRLTLEVYEANVIGRAFYEGYGFQLVGERVEEGSGLRLLRLALSPVTPGAANNIR